MKVALLTMKLNYRVNLTCISANLGLYKKKIITDLKNKEKTINTKLMKFDQANVYEKLLKDGIFAESKLVIKRVCQN